MAETGTDASLFKGYEIPEFDNLGIISTDAFWDYLKGFKKPITVESTHMRYFKVKPYLCAEEDRS